MAGISDEALGSLAAKAGLLAAWQHAGGSLRRFSHRRTVRFHADSVDHRVGAASVGHFSDYLAQVVFMLSQIQHFSAAYPSPFETLRHQIHADHSEPVVSRHTNRHLPYRPESKHDEEQKTDHGAHDVSCFPL